MSTSKNSSIVLMVQNAYRVFCYYDISPLTIKRFEDFYGEGAWENSKPVLKVFEICEGKEKERQTIFLDIFADNWYIDMEKDNMKVFIKLGRILSDYKFVSIAESNVVTTPRSGQVSKDDVHYIEILQV
ncbi:DUF4912 domain-containing protein [Clostridium aestuarii]|uniref:DUF4912 domain-containing protein n=1 Tax=Clostridium aestuarii TaxID=338193 RepID=A0ABT4CV30_9CLOT|nr:DUF4912 domain-containing protein [Clostridium aestuarii]